MADRSADSKQFTKLAVARQKELVSDLHKGLTVRQVVLQGADTAPEHYDDYIDYNDHIDY